MKPWYAYSTPEGIKLIEGDKMPVMPVYSDIVRHTHYYWQVNEYKRLLQKYEAALQAAKASSVLVQDQHKARTIIMGFITERNPKWPEQVLEIKPDTIYGPFTVGYRIEEHGSCGHPCEDYDVCAEHGCQWEHRKVVILYDDKKTTKVKCNCSCHRNPRC